MEGEANPMRVSTFVWHVTTWARQSVAMHRWRWQVSVSDFLLYRLDCLCVYRCECVCVCADEGVVGPETEIECCSVLMHGMHMGI